MWSDAGLPHTDAMQRVLAITILLGACCTSSAPPPPFDAPVMRDARPMRDAGGCVDRDGDGIDDRSEGESDVDGDGLANADDLDSDDDGLSDTDESFASGGCRYPSTCDCGVPTAFVADADADGLTDAEERTRGTDACSPDSDGDGCPDGATCGAAMSWARTDGTFGSTWTTVGYRLPDDAGPQASLELDVELPVGAEVMVRSVVAARISGGGTADGDHFVDVQPGAIVDFEIELQPTRDVTMPATIEGRTLLRGDTGVVSERLLQIYVSCSPPILI